MVDLLW